MPFNRNKIVPNHLWKTIRSWAVPAMILLIFLPGKVCAEVRILSDAELDGISAGTIAEDVLTGVDALTQALGVGGEGQPAAQDSPSALSALSTLLTAVLSSGLHPVHAENSQVTVQTNIAFVTGAVTSLTQSNTIQIPAVLSK